MLREVNGLLKHDRVILCSDRHDPAKSLVEKRYDIDKVLPSN